jgi:carbamate kinase
VSVITQVLVNRDDPAFGKPTKPIGSFYSEEMMQTAKAEHPEWVMVSDAGRGWRRVVASPEPTEILEAKAVQNLIESGYCVVAAGGGGIPVFRDEKGFLKGVDAVVDKDFASGLLASILKADTLVISTGVPKVYIGYGKPGQKALDRVTAEELKRYATEGHFAAGSMLPKIEAVIRFMDRGGREAIITNPESLSDSVFGDGGTHVVI